MYYSTLLESYFLMEGIFRTRIFIFTNKMLPELLDRVTEKVKILFVKKDFVFYIEITKKKLGKKKLEIIYNG
jgi:hypothetical protein